MNHPGGKEVTANFRTERKDVPAIARDIPEEQYGFRAAPDTRAVGEMQSHIGASCSFQSQIRAQAGPH